LKVDVIFKGLMAPESRTRAKNFLTRGYLFEGAKQEYLGGDAFFHCQPLAIWNDDDIWEYIGRYNVPYSSLYDMGFSDKFGGHHKIKRNGCMGCGTDLLYQNNHMATLRRTHPKVWMSYMGRGMAEEIIKLQRLKRHGQRSIFDCFTTEELLEKRPCYLDSITAMVMRDNTLTEDEMEFDPEAA